MRRTKPPRSRSTLISRVSVVAVVASLALVATAIAATQTVATYYRLDTFNSTATWTVPTGVRIVNSLAVGGGGGGASGANYCSGTANRSGGGGGAGGAVSETFINVVGSASVAAAVGTGGAASGYPGPTVGIEYGGGRGGNSSFSTNSASGGSGGQNQCYNPTFSAGNGTAFGTGGRAATAAGAGTAGAAGKASTISGASITYGGGGGGGNFGTNNSGAGGAGGGGKYGTLPTANSGGGGAGGAWVSPSAYVGNPGAAGLVQVRWLDPASVGNPQVTALGGTPQAANTIGFDNTDVSLSATIPAGLLTGGKVEFYDGFTLLGTDNSIAAGDTTATATTAYASAASLQTAIPSSSTVFARFTDGAGYQSQNLGTAITTSYSPPPGLDLTKTASLTSFTQVGQKITYTLIAKNTGGSAVTGVSVTDPKVSLSCTPAAPAILAAGASMNCTGQYTVTQADMDAGFVNNTATAKGTASGGVVDGLTKSASTSVVGPSPPVSGLVLTKSASPTAFTKAGQRITWTVVATNVGQVTLSGVAVSDPKASLTCSPDTPAAVAPGQAVTCIGNYTTTQADVDAGSISNTATATGLPAGGGALITQSASLTVPGPAAAPKLSITKASTPSTYASVGDKLTYTITATNSGNVTIGNVSVTDPKVTLSCSPAIPTAKLSPGQSVVCTGSYAITQADLDSGKVSNTASATAATQAGGSLSDTASLDVTGVPPTPQISLVKTSTPTTFSAAGDVIAYTVTASNTGNATLSNVSVTDPMGSLNCTPASPVSSLAPGASVSCTLNHTVTALEATTGSVSNTASVTGKAPDGTTDATAQATLRVNGPTPNPQLSLTKSGPATYSSVGEVLSYSITATNTGNVQLTGVGVVDAKLASLACSPSGSVTLDPGDKVTCSGTYTVTQADIDSGTISNRATAAGNDLLSDPVSAAATFDSIGPTAAPSLKATKTASTNLITSIGQSITYTVTVENTGNTTVTGITAEDPLFPSGMPCLKTTLAPSEKTTCTATYVTKAADLTGSLLTNSAAAGGTPARGILPASPASLSLSVQPPSLDVTKSVSPSTFAAAGDVLTYTVTASNKGGTQLSGVKVTDPKTTLTCAPASPSTLVAGATISCSGQYKVTQADVDAGKVVNTATAAGTTAGGAAGAITASASATATGPAPAPGLSVSRSASPATFSAVGQKIAVTVIATNTGNVGLSGVSVSDPRVTLTCTPTAPAKLNPGESMVCTGFLTVTQADLDAGSISASTSASGTPPSGAPVSGNADATIPGPAAAPKLSLAKSSVPNSYAHPGDQVKFSVVATNNGNVTLSNVSVSDADVTLSCTPTIPAASLAPGESISCLGTHSATQADIDAGNFTNSATANGTDPGASAVDASASVVVNAASPIAKISVDKTAAPVTFGAEGDTVTYTIRATNTGTLTLSNVDVTDPMGTPLCSPVTPVASLAPGASVTCTYAHTVTALDAAFGRIDNTASASAKAPDGSDAIAQDGGVVVYGPVPNPRLSVSKTSNGRFDKVGDVVNYTITASNTGNVTLNAVNVNDPQLSSIHCTPSAPSTLTAGAAMVCTGSHTVTQADVDRGLISNSATASSKTASNKAVPAIGSLDTPGPIAAPSLSSTKSASRTTVTAPGQEITWTVTVTNTGNVTIGSIAVRDPHVPAGFVCAQRTLAPGSSTTCVGVSVTTEADMALGAIQNTAAVTGSASRGVLSSTAALASVGVVPTPIKVADLKPRAKVKAGATRLRFGFNASSDGLGTVTLSKGTKKIRGRTTKLRKGANSSSISIKGLAPGRYKLTVASGASVTTTWIVIPGPQRFAG